MLKQVMGSLIEEGSCGGNFDLRVCVYGRRWGNQISGGQTWREPGKARDSMLANQCALDSRAVRQHRNGRLKERL
jgi:hypothetical protein